jgi:hypothetical protein
MSDWTWILVMVLLLGGLAVVDSWEHGAVESLGWRNGRWSHLAGDADGGR